MSCKDQQVQAQPVLQNPLQKIPQNPFSVGEGTQQEHEPVAYLAHFPLALGRRWTQQETELGSNHSLFHPKATKLGIEAESKGVMVRDDRNIPSWGCAHSGFSGRKGTLL
jgi:hypothetical protein